MADLAIVDDLSNQAVKPPDFVNPTGQNMSWQFDPNKKLPPVGDRAEGATGGWNIIPSFDNAKSEAIINNDPKPLLKVAASTEDDATRAAALHVAGNVQKGNDTWTALTSGIDKKGGVQSPDGRIEFEKQWRNNDNNPQYKNALMQYFLGDKKAGRSFLTGGQQTTKVTWDQTTGKPIQYKVDQNGEIHGAFDGQREISPEEFYTRTKFASGLENTLGYLADKSNVEVYTKEAQKTIGNAKALAAASPVMNTLYQQLDDSLTGLKELPPEAQAKVLQFSSSSVGTSQTVSQAAQKLNQLIGSGSFKEGSVVDEKLAAGLGKDGIGTVNANGGVNFSDGTTLTSTDLKQLQSSGNVSNSIENKYNQSKQDLIAYLKTSDLAKTNPEGVLKLQSALEIAKTIALQESKLPSHSFNIPTVGFGVTDPYARGRVQAAQGQFNSQVNSAFDTFVTQQMKNVPAGSPPRPGELEAAFTKQPEYQLLLKDYKAKANAILKEPVSTGGGPNVKDTGVTIPTGSAVAPSLDQLQTSNVTLPTMAGSKPPPTTAGKKDAKKELEALTNQFRK
tara:strand:- start:1685 stop:3370 length:1686 start_codon:yes stop_codon:yes gene_type:complete